MEIELSSLGSLRELLRESPLFLVKQARLEAADLVGWAARIGTPMPSPRPELSLSDHPEIMRIGNVKNRTGKVVAGNARGLGWHSDMSYRSRPPDLTLLYALEVPSRGGETEFASMDRVYDQLDPATAEAWTGLEVEHRTPSKRFEGAPDRMNVHPLLLRHPQSGRETLFYNPQYAHRVLGVDEEASRRILDRIDSFLGEPDYAHRWSPGDLLIWDNRTVLHRATWHDPDQPRHLWRMIVQVE